VTWVALGLLAVLGFAMAYPPAVEPIKPLSEGKEKSDEA
jgi:hypothetical protein